MSEKRQGLLGRLLNRRTIEEKVKVTESAENLGGTVLAIKELAVNKPVMFSGINPLELDDSKLLDFYNVMDADAIISAGLDLYADNATQENRKTGHVASIESQDIQFKQELNEFLWDFVKVDTEAWDWVRRLVKDGKLFLDTKAVGLGKDWSFVPVENPAGITALVQGQHDIRYYLVKESTANDNDYYQIASAGKKDDNSTKLEPKSRYISAFYKPRLQGTVDVQTESAIDGSSTTETLNVKNGRSLLYSVKNDWQALCALEDAVFQSRLAKSRNFRIVQIDVADSNNEQAKDIVNAVKNAMRSSESINAQEGRYSSRQSPVPIDDFVYNPVRGVKGAITVTPVTASQEATIPMQDIEYFRNKVFAGLSVLKAYLGFEETTPGGLGDSTLTMLDERLGRRIKSIQNILKKIVKDIVTYYWINSDTKRTVDNMPKFSVELGQVSTKGDKEVVENLDTAITTANNFLAMLESEVFKNRYSEEKVFKYVFGNLLGIELSAIDTTTDKSEVNIELKQLRESVNVKKYATGKQPHYYKDGKLNTLVDLLEHKELSDILEDYDVFLESETGKIVPLAEAINRPAFRSVMNEKSYKELKQKTKATDPKRIAKSKKLTVKYLGLDENNYITFRVTAEDPKANAAAGRPTSYETKVSLKDLSYVIKENMDEKNPLKDKELVQLAMQGDVSVACDCPASKYWGQQYNGTKQDYSIVKNNIEPTRNRQYQTLCKHVVTMLTVMPFWWTSVVRDLRKKGLLSKKGLDLGDNKTEETQNVNQEEIELKSAEAKL